MSIEYVGMPVDTVKKLTAFQAMSALTAAGYIEQIKAYMNADTTDPFLKLRWEKALTFRRDHPDVLLIASMLGLSDEQLDQLFELGETFVL